MSDLLKKQFQFTAMLADLLAWIATQGYNVKVGEVLRPSILAKMYAGMGVGVENSKHVSAMAADIQIFAGEHYLTDTSMYEFAGKYWESKGGIWGGRFKKQDGNHFEL